MRTGGRAADQLRPVRFTRRFTSHAEGSVLCEFGGTRVLCTASVENGVPSFLRGSGKGWLTAEYGMLPRATHTRSAREAARGKQGGPHAGDPAPDRPVAARLHRPRGDRRAHHHDRLRRAPGGRRHAHGGDHRRLCRARRRDRYARRDEARSPRIRCTARSPRSRSAS